MSSVALSAGPIHHGLDTSKNAVLVGILGPDEVSADVEKIFNDEPSIRRLVDRFADRSMLRGVLRGGPDRVRLEPAAAFDGGGLRCGGAVAGATRAGGSGQDRPARLPPAGPTAPGRELVTIRVPPEGEEAVRDPCRSVST